MMHGNSNKKSFNILRPVTDGPVPELWWETKQKSGKKWNFFLSKTSNVTAGIFTLV